MINAINDAINAGVCNPQHIFTVLDLYQILIE